MTDINNRVLDLLKENKSLKEISAELKISEKQLYIRIKQIINCGYNMTPEYYYNSNIFYRISKAQNTGNLEDVRISMSKKSNSFRCLVISDLHIGNKDSNIKLIDDIYEYATKNGINIILNCGDIIEGDYTDDKKYISDFEGQLTEFIKKYPYDKNITNFTILGNHDFHSLTNNGFDVSRKIKEARYDIVPIGYGQGNVNIKSDSVALVHKLGKYNETKGNSKLILSGHGHMMKTKLYDKLILCVPTLSYVSTNKPVDILPGFMDLDVSIENGKFEFVSAKHLVLAPKVYQVSETRCRMKDLKQ